MGGKAVYLCSSHCEIRAVTQAEFKQFIQKNSYLDLASGSIFGMLIHKSFGLGTLGINTTSLHPMCSSPWERKMETSRLQSVNSFSDQSFLTRSVLAAHLWGPEVFQTWPCFAASPCMGQEVSEETCPLDVQTITNEPLLENTLLMKPSAYSLTHRGADEADKPPLVFKKQVSSMYKCSFPVAPWLYPSGMFCWACGGSAPRKAQLRHDSPTSTAHLLCVFTWFMATCWKYMCRCMCMYMNK